MKTMVLTGIRQMELRETPTPEIKNETDVLIRMKRVGVCGSDVHYYTEGKIGSQLVEFPHIVGHEGAGVVEKVGSGVTQVKPGDRIAVEPAVSCGECDQCIYGRTNTCRNLNFLACPKELDGCLSEDIVMPEECCFKIKDSMSFDQAAISEPLAIGVYAVKKSIPMHGAKIGILGTGPIGLSVLMPALAQGAEKIYVTDKLDKRLEVAKKAGASITCNVDKEDAVAKIAENEPELLDAVFECCGEQDAVSQAIKLLKPGGKLIIIGIPPTLKMWELPVDVIRRKEIIIQNIRRQSHCVQDALDMIDDKAFDVDVMVTHHFKLEDTKEAFDMVAEYKDGVLKAMIEI